MKTNFFFLCILFFFPIYGLFSNQQWMDQQIQDDCQLEKFSRSELRRYFYQLANEERQVLFASIRKNKIYWELAPKTDAHRNGLIFNFFRKFLNQYCIADTAFVLHTGDAVEFTPILPLFGLAKNKRVKKNALLLPDHDLMIEFQRQARHKMDKLIQACPWDEKIEYVFFRGSDTGHGDVNQNTRMKAVEYSLKFPYLLDATFSQTHRPAFSNRLKELNIPLEYRSIQDHLQYKYLLDIDGNACTYGRIRMILRSNSTLLKTDSQYTQWYHKALIPNVHYILIKDDFSNLEEVTKFLKAHDHIAKRIADEGRKLEKKILSECMTFQYMKKLFDTYTKKMNKF